MALDDTRIPSPSDSALTCSVGGEAATGDFRPSDPVARLVPVPCGALALNGHLALSVHHRDGVRVLSVSLDGRDLDAALDDATRDHLLTLLAEAPR